MIKNTLQRDVVIKIAAVILALSMWVMVNGLVNPVTTDAINVDLKIEVPEGKILTQPQPNAIRVAMTLKGRTHVLEQIKPEDLKATIDTSKAPSGQSTLPVEYTSPYPGVEVIDVNPAMITITLTTRESKEVGITVAAKGTPNKEFNAGKPAFAESSVTVTGPKSNVERVQIVAGEIDVTGAVASTNARVTLLPKDAAGNEVAQVVVEPSEIDVTVQMIQKQPAKTVPVKVDTTGTPKTGYKLAGVSVSPDYVEIRGSASVTSKIDAISTQPVSVDGRESGFSFGVNLKVPAGVTLETTARVTASFNIQPDIVTKTFSKVYVQPIDLPVGYTFKIDPTEIDVVLSGRSDILAQVKATDVQAFIDASGISPSEAGGKGDFPLPVYLGDLPAGIKIENISSSRVTLTLTKR